MIIENAPSALKTREDCLALARQAHEFDHISSAGTGNEGPERLKESEMIAEAWSNIELIRSSIGKVIAFSKK